MILEREQIQRYLRHILIPEVSGPGQKKLLDSSALVYCDSLTDSAFMLYYLAAMGIGELHCYAEHAAGQELLIDNLFKLNPDVKVSITAGAPTCNCSCNHRVDIVIIASKKPEVHIDFDLYSNIPVIFTAAAGDRGFIKTKAEKDAASSALKELYSFYTQNNSQEYSLFAGAAASLTGILAAVETIKALLKIGFLCEAALQFDLATYEFVYGTALSRHKSYFTDMKQIYQKLRKAKALIVGSGGLGSPAAYMLASMGIDIGLVDFDTVELSNLNRQILHNTDRIGMTKVQSAKEFLSKLNPEIEIAAYEQRFSKHNAEQLLSGYDIIIDGLDNLATRYILNDACYLQKKTLIEAGVLGFNGLTTVILPDSGPCYRCTFPEETGKKPVPS